ncbi:MAG: FAD-binding oxidoreductase [Candidatus Acidiferrum sp.]
MKKSRESIESQTLQADSSRRHFLKKAALSSGGGLAAVAGLNQISPLIWPEHATLEPNRSYWARSQSPQHAALSSDVTVDVAVLGGGLTGLSTAYFICAASPTKRVVVLEGKGCGNGASGRNGGMVLTMTEDRYMRFSSDPAMDKKIYDLTAENIRWLSRLGEETGIDCELETNGALQVLTTPADVREGKAYVQQAQTLGMPVEFWDAAKVAQALGTEAYQGGLFDPSCGHVHPMKLVNTFKVAAQKAGAEIFENTMVERIEEGEQHVLHTTLGHTVKAKALVLATNAFTGRLGFFRNSVVPVREYVAVTRPLSEQELAAIGWRAHLPFNDTRTEVFYLGLTKGRRIHIGGGGPSYTFNNGFGSDQVERSHVQELRRELVRIYPGLAGVEFEANWDGLIDWSMNESPAVGCTGKHNNIFYGLGYSGHGINLTSVFGRVIADLYAGRGERWNEYPFVNAKLNYIPNEPFRWLGVQAGLAWYRLTGG